MTTVTATSRDTPNSVRTRLNQLASSAPVVFRMTGDGPLAQQEQGGGADAVVARETLVLAAGPDRQRVRRCHAPSCGMFFLATP